MENDFKSLGVSDKLQKGLAAQGIMVPMLAQSLLMGPMCEKRDVIIQSETGSGKTLAYLLPLFTMIDTSVRATQAIILTPTHELAAQVYKQAELLAANSELSLRSMLIIGGASMLRQIEKLKEKPHIIIGSSGRILDLIQKKKINAQSVKTIVIDEADRMMDSLNIDGLKAVIKTTLKDRQIVALSASINEATLEAAKNLMKDYEFLKTKEIEKLPENISHFYIKCDFREKIELVRKIVHGEKAEKTIVFLNNPENIEVTVEKLNFHALKAAGIYGGAYKTQRREALEDFRQGRINVLVASDIGARGLDIEGVTHVINLDIPEEPVYYLHRAGRTGRKGESGIVISIITEYEKKWINKYKNSFQIEIEPKKMAYGKMTSESEKKEDRPSKKPLETVKKEKRKSKEKKDNKKVATTKKKKFIQPKKDSEMGFFARKAEKQANKQKNLKK